MLDKCYVQEKETFSYSIIYVMKEEIVKLCNLYEKQLRYFSLRIVLFIEIM